MFTSTQPGRPTRPRRGVILIVVLALLSIIALIGVTFATLSGQAQVGARYYALSLNAPDPETVFDYALNQLINDTNNLKSMLRGHSLLRDAYGNDAFNNGMLAALPGGAPLQATLVNTLPDDGGGIGPPLYGTITRVLTNIPYNPPGVPQLFGLDFTRWVLRVNPQPNPNAPPALLPAQTLEVLRDVNAGGFHQLDLTFELPPTDPAHVPLATLNIANATFTLDGRYLRAFNGSGVAASMVPSSVTATGFADAGLPNFLFNGVGIPIPVPPLGGPPSPIGDPNAVAMDEDYDACDLENFFLAIQSADGNVIMPSFYRPGIIASSTDPLLDDWRRPDWTAKAKFLRPRAIDHGSHFETFPDLLPDPNTGRITYDVDNDGDGVTDSVWIDLGYPAQRTSDGRLYKPLFAFMILGLNGRLPLNTVGNLAGRRYDDDPNTLDLIETGSPTFNQTSHLGASVSEINPQFAFLDPAIMGLDTNGDGLIDSLNPVMLNYEIEQLRKLLAGDFAQPGDPTTGQPGVGPVPGRWGEPGQLDPNPLNTVAYLGISSRFFPGYNIRAGRSMPQDGRNDTQFNSTDFFPPGNAPNGPESANTFDAAGGVMFPSERMRYFVLPTDPVGAGRVMAWNERPNLDPNVGLPAYLDFGRGFDTRGRSSYFLHFRPPGFVPGITNMQDILTAPQANAPFYLSPNHYHGHEAHRDPIGPGVAANPQAPLWDRILYGAAPWDMNDGTAVPTYNPITISSPQNLIGPIPYPPPAPGSGGRSVLPGGSLTWGEADQMNLYQPDSHDEVFTYQDLEWLYRNRDFDASALDSRLARLGPRYPDPVTGIRFFDPSTPRHNRLFSLESWESFNFAYAHDNPGNVFPNNHRFNTAAPASFVSQLAATPAIAQGDARINLNFPLPRQTRCDEPTRLKWIRETYYLLKHVLPPKAVDHPEELAALGQFVVNIIDFRDTDDVMTIWTNPDVRLTDATATASSRVVFTNDPAATTDLVHYGMEYQPVAISEILAYSFKRRSGNGSIDTARFFLELVDVLTRNGQPAPDDTASDMDLKDWDIVVTREDDTGTGFARPNPVTGQLHFDVDDPNLVANATPTPVAPPAGVYAKRAFLAPTTGLATAAGLGTKMRALPQDGTPNQPADRPYYYVFGYHAPTTPGGQPIEQKQDGTTDLRGDTSDPAFRDPNAILRKDDNSAEGVVTDLLPEPPQSNQYYWLYLRRPANPNLPVQPNKALANYNPRVVIDSMRFPYVESGGTGQMNGQQRQVTQGQQKIWSVQRFQPLRGGQAVPNRADAPSATYEPANAYGYSEQVENTDQQQNPPDLIYGVYDPAFPSNANPNNRITQEIRHTIGRRPGTDRQWNASNNDAQGREDEWDGFVFLDRDFQSVAELALVPVSPPGLFTKHFVENLPELSGTTPHSPADTPPGRWLPVPPHTGNFPYRTVPQTPPTNEEDGAELANDEGPHSYPYLSDNFFYSADGRSTHDNAPTANPPGSGPVAFGPTGAGWNRMLAFFEVPSNSFGAIGPVASGQNRDWHREALRPGLINLNLIIDEEVFFGLLDDPRLNYAAAQQAPALQVATQANPDPTILVPTASYNVDMQHGFFYEDPAAPPGSPPVTVMKEAFREFLMLRHGGSGVLFGRGPEHPFHDLSYPDIFYTILRPAAPAENAVFTLRQNTNPTQNDDPTTPDDDPIGVKKQTALTVPPAQGQLPLNVLQPPPVPPRRLFEIRGKDFATTWVPPAGVIPVNLFDQTTNPLTGNTRYELGNAGGNDRRQHAAFRLELLHKLANLSTVRTHQYAVWVTIGYFEVEVEGDTAKAIATGNPEYAYDRLGREIGREAGTNVRHRAFFIVDRSRAGGFNPTHPEDFRNLIRYRRRIE
jgi:hypothetical protein